MIINFVLKRGGGALVKAAVLFEESTGRKVELFTTQPGLQLYTGYYIPEFRFPGEKTFLAGSRVWHLNRNTIRIHLTNPDFRRHLLNPMKLTAIRLYIGSDWINLGYRFQK